LERFDISLFESYSSLLKESKFSDVKLNVEGIDIMAHKSILSSRSPVFAAMFEHQMKESTENVVKIVDMSTEVANELLHFIYSGKVDNLKKVAKDLLAAADKYQLPQLVEMCEEHLMANLTTDTAPQVLVLSHLHKALKLKTVVVEFIIANRKDVMKSDNWQLIKQQPDLMEELFKALSNFCDKNSIVFCP
jgi:speckle-type POZ protein